MTLFPGGGLDQSILVTVLVGVFVLLALTEWFGWVWAGLVVPGYLASVFAIQPAAGAAICFEAIMTFVVSRWASDTLSRWGGWSPFFGRERFFLIVLVSVIVRQVSELWVIEAVLGIYDDYTGASTAASRDFASIGLVLVPLLANMAWKLSLRRAVFQIGVSVAITWIIVAGVLLPLTNLSYSSLELTYENVALDFLASPKAYIILLTTAFMAARFNLTYGWDYNGILVPSLIALTWFQPWLLVATVVESLVLAFAARAALAFPLLKRRNLEGPRKLAFVLSVGFVLKLALGWALVLWWPGARVTDFFGFGYVLTSLLAVKMLNLKKTGRVVLPSIAVSLLGYVTASGIGIGLEQIAPRMHATVKRGPEVATSQRLWRTPLGVMALATVRAQSDRGPRNAEIDSRLLADYASLWGEVERWLRQAPQRASSAAGRLVIRAERLGLRLVQVHGADRLAWAVIDAEEQLAAQSGWETALLFPGSPGPVIVVPRPGREQPAAEAATALCDGMQCRAILVSGSDGRLRSSFFAARRALSAQVVVELHGDTSVAKGHPTIHIRHVLPDMVRLPALWPGQAELTWDPPPGWGDRWRSNGSDVVIRAHPGDLRQRLAQTAPAVAERARTSMIGWLDAWYEGISVADPSRSPDSSPSPPSPPSPTELLVLERLILSRLATGSRETAPYLSRLASTLDHRIEWLPHAAPNGGAWVLSGDRHRGWIAVAIAERPAEALVLEVPRPRTETGVGRVATQLWEAAGAAALVLDGEWSASAQADGSMPAYPDVVGLGAVETAFHAAHEALTGDLTEEAAILQLRGFASTRGIGDDIVVSVGEPVFDAARVPPAIARVVAKDGPIGRLGTSLRWVDGSADLVELAGAGDPQLLYARATGVASFAIVWLAESIRISALPVGDYEDTQQRAAGLGLAFFDQPVATALTAGLVAPSRPREIPSRLSAALEVAKEYATRLDIAALAQVSEAKGVTVSLGWGADPQGAYVLLEMKERSAVTRAAVLIGPTAIRSCSAIDAGAHAKALVQQAIATRCRLLVVAGEEPR